MLEIINRFNKNFELVRILDYTDSLEIKEEAMDSCNFYKNYIKIKNWYFYQEFYDEDESTYNFVIGNVNGDMYNITQLDITDQNMVNRLKQFISNFYNFFGIFIANEYDFFCKFFLFILSVIAFDHETDYNSIVDRYNRLSLDFLYDTSLLDLSTIFDQSYSPG